MNTEKKSLFVWTLVIIGGTYLLGQGLPWWSFAPFCLLIGFVARLNPINAFTIGFFCVFAAWLLQAYLINEQNEGILAEKMGQVMVGINPFGLLVMTGAIGGIGGGLSLALGASLRISLNKRRLSEPTES